MEQSETRAGRKSRTRVRRLALLRRWLLGGVLVLLLALAGLLGYARYRARRFLADIPHRLGIDVKSETNGFTLSQSVKGHTLFSVHAAKAIQRQNGKTTLHDVAITLYGPQGSNQTDSIRGDEFEYDEQNGIVRAAGEVHMDLAAPAQEGAKTAGVKRIAVTTSGLVLLQKLGVAATDQPIHLLYGDLQGGAVGADYESDTGVLRLRSAVHLDGMQDGTAVHLDAASAEMDRQTKIATLHAAHLHSNAGSAAGDRMVITMGPNSVKTVEAEGRVEIAQFGGLRATAPHMNVGMNDTGKPQTATMSGGVQFRDDANTGSAATALIHFDGNGRPHDLDLQRTVHLQTESASGAHSNLNAGRIVAQLVANGKRSEVRDAVASGGAELRTVEPVAAASGKGQTPSGKRPSMRTTVVTAATLHAITAIASGSRYVSVVEGSGGTRFDQSDDAGNLRSSTGDTLHADLLPPAAAGTQRGSAGALHSAVQTGHVVITEHRVQDAAAKPGKTPGSAQNSRATAQTAELDAATQRLVLTGDPRVTTPGVELAADRIVLAQATGAADAQGSVRGTLVQDPSRGEPVHILAAHAEIAGDIARFTGGEKPARMWNSAAQLQASAIDLDRTKNTLAAHPGAQGKTVQLLLPAATAGRQTSQRESGSVLVTGEDLLMTGATGSEPGHIDVSRGVRMVSAGSNLQADHLQATLKASGRGAPAAGPFSGGSVESILATGGVRLQQPGRTGTGERLLYTAADERYVLTGTPGVQPSIEDSLRGSVTGATLIFHGGDDSVEVAGESGRRVRSVTEPARLPRRR